MIISSRFQSLFKDALIAYIYYVQSHCMAGSFSYQFTSPGIHYYSSGYVDEAHSIFLQGVINVLPAETRHIPLHLFVGSSEATYAQGKMVKDGNSVTQVTQGVCDISGAGSR